MISNIGDLMFKKGDDIFIVDNGRWNKNKQIVIQKRTFVTYTTLDESRLEFTGASTLNAASWAVSASVEDATKFAVAYLIKTECFGETISSMNGVIEYMKIEKEHPDLIFKYMDKVVEM